MSEASETIWARPHPYEPDWTDDEDLATTGHTKYRRADLPATDEHAFANEKVKALQHSLGQLLQVQDGLPMMGIEATRRSDQARAEAAEAALFRVYQMGLDAASVHCEKLDLGWKDRAGLQVYPSATYCAVAIRGLTPPADLVQQATKGGE